LGLIKVDLVDDEGGEGCNKNEDNFPEGLVVLL
jgi:hypothetical protein